jgi:hypothetical protein
MARTDFSDKFPCERKQLPHFFFSLLLFFFFFVFFFFVFFFFVFYFIFLLLSPIYFLCSFHSFLFGFHSRVLTNKRDNRAGQTNSTPRPTKTRASCHSPDLHSSLTQLLALLTSISQCGNAAHMAFPAAIRTGRVVAGVKANHINHNDSDGGGDDCTTTVRCNGRDFHIEMSPFFFSNSPTIATRYRKFLAAARDDDYELEKEEKEKGKEEEESDDPDIVLREFHAWLITVFEPVFLQVAPDLPPSFDPEKLAPGGDVKPVFSEYLFPEEYRCRLEADNDAPIPILMPGEESPFPQPLNDIYPDLAQELRQYVAFFDPSAVEVSFQDPAQAVSGMPTRVAVVDDAGLKTTCFLKSFGVEGILSLEHQLETHLRILKSTLPREARVVRLRGVVALEDGQVAGLLLTYVDHRRRNGGVLFEDGVVCTPVALRQRWARQVQETVEQLHGAGIVWGDARIGNVMVDVNDDAWLVGFGGGYTTGWVDEDKAGTVEGDLQGVAKIFEMLSNEEYEPYSDKEEA